MKLLNSCLLAVFFLMTTNSYASDAQNIPQRGDKLEAIGESLPLRANPPGYFQGKGEQVGNLFKGDQVIVIDVKGVPRIDFQSDFFNVEIWVEVCDASYPIWYKNGLPFHCGDDSAWVYMGTDSGIETGASNFTVIN